MVCVHRGSLAPVPRPRGAVTRCQLTGAPPSAGTSSAVTPTLDGPYSKPDKWSHLGSMCSVGSVCSSEKEAPVLQQGRVLSSI